MRSTTDFLLKPQLRNEIGDIELKSARKSICLFLCTQDKKSGLSNFAVGNYRINLCLHFKSVAPQAIHRLYLNLSRWIILWLFNIELFNPVFLNRCRITWCGAIGRILLKNRVTVFSPTVWEKLRQEADELADALIKLVKPEQKTI